MDSLAKTNDKWDSTQTLARSSQVSVELVQLCSLCLYYLDGLDNVALFVHRCPRVTVRDVILVKLDRALRSLRCESQQDKQGRKINLAC